MNTPFGKINTNYSNPLKMGGQTPTPAGLRVLPTPSGNDRGDNYQGTKASVIQQKSRDFFKNSSFGVVPTKRMQSYKKGGIVHKTGPALLHKGELVVPKHAVDAMHKKWMLSDGGAVKYSDHSDAT